MAHGPETRFIKSIHRLIPNVHAEKMNNPYRSGTPDVFYSGHRGDLWIEYKFLAPIPITANIIPDLSPRQEEWCEARFREGRNIAVVVGTDTGGVIFRDLEWMSPMSPNVFRARLVPKRDIALWIFNQVGAKACPSTLHSTMRTKQL